MLTRNEEFCLYLSTLRYKFFIVDPKGNAKEIEHRYLHLFMEINKHIDTCGLQQVPITKYCASNVQIYKSVVNAVAFTTLLQI